MILEAPNTVGPVIHVTTFVGAEKLGDVAASSKFNVTVRPYVTCTSDEPSDASNSEGAFNKLRA